MLRSSTSGCYYEVRILSPKSPSPGALPSGPKTTLSPQKNAVPSTPGPPLDPSELRNVSRIRPWRSPRRVPRATEGCQEGSGGLQEIARASCSAPRALQRAPGSLPRALWAAKVTEKTRENQWFSLEFAVGPSNAERNGPGTFFKHFTRFREAL